MPWRSPGRSLDLASVKNILVIRLDHIGDVVMARPAIRALHKKFPHAAIDLLVTEDIAPLFDDSKEIRTVIAANPGWFNRKASFGKKWSEFWRLVSVLKNSISPKPRHSDLCAFSRKRDQREESQKGDPSSSSGLRMTDDSLVAASKTEGYDLGIDLRGDLRNILLMFLSGVKYTVGYGISGGGFLLNEEVPYDPSQHQVRLNLNLLNSFHVVQDDKLLPFEYSPEKAREFWQKDEVMPPATLLPRIAIHLGSGYPSKRWPFENFRALIQKINMDARAQIVLIGTEAEKDAVPDLKLSSERLVDLRGKTDLRDLPVLLDVCDVYIGGDSGPAHIAAAQGLEVLLLASGTNDIRLWHPWTERLSLLQHEVPCSPCGLEVCPVEGHPCVEEITVDQACDALFFILNRLQKKS
jgi:ADP-heptose:LPS heptosyltransferase